MPKIVCIQESHQPDLTLGKNILFDWMLTISSIEFNLFEFLLDSINLCNFRRAFYWSIYFRIESKIIFGMSHDSKNIHFPKFNFIMVRWLNSTNRRSKIDKNDESMLVNKWKNVCFVCKFKVWFTTKHKFEIQFSEKAKYFFSFDGLTTNCHLDDVSVNFHAIAPHTDSHKTKQKIRKIARK